MAASFSHETIDNIKNNVNIVDVVGQVVPLKRAGSNYKGVCPFHNEKTPSFVVSETKQIFTCFGCGAQGDSIEFVKKYYNLDFTEAVEKIAREYNIPIKKTGRGENFDKYYEANTLAAKFFYNAFTRTKNKGYPYMVNRGISKEVMVKFGIGYADEEWESLYNFLKSKGVEDKTMLELGLVSRGKNGKFYDRFRNRVMFPIINTSGKVIGFGGRAIDPNDNPKYLNSPESKVFKKKNNIYGLNLSRQSIGKENFFILVEGYMDTIALYQGGVKNVGATLGTALTENQAKLIKRYTKDVVLSYDADEAGRNAALRGMDILKSEGCKVRVLHVTDGKDPDEFIKKNGKQAFLDLVDNSLQFCDYKIESAKVGYNLDIEDDKLEYLKKVTAILKTFSPVEQDIYAKKVANDLKISEGALKLELKGENLIDVEQVRPKPKFEQEKEEQVEEVSYIEKDLIRLVTRDESYIDKILSFPQMLESDISQRIMGEIMECACSESGLDCDKVMERLDDRARNVFTEIMENIPVGGNEEEIFSECVSNYKIKKLEEEEKRIITQFSLLDSDTESSHDDEILKLMKKLKEIQEKIQIEKENRGQ